MIRLLPLYITALFALAVVVWAACQSQKIADNGRWFRLRWIPASDKMWARFSQMTASRFAVEWLDRNQRRLFRLSDKRFGTKQERKLNELHRGNSS